jgi:hypothetical protein
LALRGHSEARGVSLLERALDVARARGEPEPPLELALARALAEHLDDLPTAIAHASAIPASAPEAPIARGLEGRWRARLGDLAGAALAFARLRDLAASRAPTSHDAAASALAALLLEAARMERDQRQDLLAAQRHLAALLRLAPHHTEGRQVYREIGAALRRDAGAVPFAEAPFEVTPAPSAVQRVPLPSPARTPHALQPTAAVRALASPAPAPPSPPAPPVDLSVGDEEDAERAERAAQLTRRLHDAPGDDTIANELAALLEDLGRGHELVALMAGRIEDAPSDRRPALVARARSAFERLATRAEAAGRTSDAALYRDAIESLARG